MQRTLRISAGIVALGTTLFIGGALLPQRGEQADRAAATDRLPRIGVTTAATDVDSAISSLRRRISEGPSTLAADQAALAFAYLQKARLEADPTFYDRAQEALRASFDAQPGENFEATLGTAILAGSRHDFHGQLEWAQRAVDINPYNSQGLGIVGDAYLELGFNNKAVGAYQKMVDLRPDLSSFGRISYIAQVHGDTTAAIQAMKRALQFAGTSRNDAAWAHWQLAELYIGANRLDQAQDHLDSALELVPSFGSALESTAHVAAARGRIVEAIEILVALVEDSPLPANYVFLGELHLLNGQDRHAEAAFEEADQRLEVYASHGVRSDLDFVTFWADRGLHLKRALNDARTLYSQRKSAAASDALAWALYANGRFHEAQRYAREAIRRSVGDAGYHYHAALIARALGDRDATRSLLQKALRLDPSWSIIESHRARNILTGSRETVVI